MEGLIGLGSFLVLLTIGYVSGRMIEKRHYRSILQREHELLALPVVGMKTFAEENVTVKNVRMVTGSVVISVDYFKKFLAGLRFFFGGRVRSYESLLDRARREATLRMKEQAKGANIILNVRFETVSITKGGRKNSVNSVVLLVYGTAITYEPAPAQAATPQLSQPAQPVAAPKPAAAPVTTAETRYKVVFTGEIAPAQTLETVKTNVAALYKVPVAQCERMFTGQAITIKDNVDYQTAQKYHTAFQRTGALCRIETV